MAQLHTLRNSIDDIDAQIISLLAQRFDYTHQIGLYKKQHHIDPHDPIREHNKLTDLHTMAMEYHLDPDLINDIFVRIMQEAVCNHHKLQKTP